MLLVTGVLSTKACERSNGGIVTIIELTIKRNDDLYERFPDIAAAPDGARVCTYRESMAHSSRPLSRSVVRRVPTCE